ncbi:hypothetical protein EVAR_80434_1 [Eumeta japonica]|uniref:Uncharacterized protein n=1 Tax=Eumeta variegata TaxID=151549 RepID=A0A4C1VHT8_EUMVA|nr:hypothetical protein EVAR_80434_1 [Eumeta japonica]
MDVLATTNESPVSRCSPPLMDALATTNESPESRWSLPLMDAFATTNESLEMSESSGDLLPTFTPYPFVTSIPPPSDHSLLHQISHPCIPKRPATHS